MAENQAERKTAAINEYWGCAATVERKKYIGLMHDPSVMRAESLLSQLALPIASMHLGKTARFVTFEATEREADQYRRMFQILEEVQVFSKPPEPPEPVIPFGKQSPDLPALMEYLGITEIWKDPDFKAGAGLTYAHIDTGLINDDKRFGTRIKGTYYAPGISTSPTAYKDRHGTIGCSIVAREITSDGETPYQGALFKLNLIDIQVLDSQGYGSTDGVAWGIDKAAELDVDWMNLSLGGPHSAIIDECVRCAREKGIIVVCAAGNSGQYPPACNGTLSCPADAPDALAVGATDGGFYEVPDQPTEPPDHEKNAPRTWMQETVQTWASRNPIPWSGKTQENYDSAPGTKIKVGIVDGPASGTSFASPTKGATTGLCLEAACRALASLSKKERAERVIKICYETDVDLGYGVTKPAEAKCLQGYGRPNVVAAYRKILGEPQQPPKFSMSGTVVDNKTQLLVMDANVLLKDHSAVTTLADGKYLFEDLLAGTYVLETSKEGYHSRSDTVTITDSNVKGVIFLTPKDLPQPAGYKVLVDGVEFTGNKIEVTKICHNCKATWTIDNWHGTFC